MTIADLKKILRNLPKGNDNTEVSIMGSSKPTHVYLIDNDKETVLLLDEDPTDALFNDWEIKDGTVKEIKY